jgi:hypothetical protein
MALITVVLISALVFASIIGITMKVVPENKMVAARSSSQRASTAAETGLSQVLFNLRNADFAGGTTAPPASDEYLDILDVRNIAQYPEHTAFAYGETTVPGGTGTPYVTYSAKIEKTSGAAFDPDDIATAVPTTLAIYSLGTIYDKQNGTVLARKAILTECGVLFGAKSDVSLEYGLVSGGTIKFIGGSNRVFHGDIYAGGNITKNSAGGSTIVLDGTAYAGGSVDSGIVPVTDPPSYQEGVPSPSDSIDEMNARLNAKYSKTLATAFRDGTAPYDGSDSNYPTTKRDVLGLTPVDTAILNNIFDSYLGDPTDFAKVASLYTDLESGKIRDDNGAGLSVPGKAWVNALMDPDYRELIVCYYNGNVTKKELGDVGWKLGGGLIIEGSLTVNSSGTINPDPDPNQSPPDPNPLVLRVMGNVDLGGGGTLNGNIYASGENKSSNKKIGVGNFTLNGYLFTALVWDIDVGGAFTCNGSLITKGNIDLNGTTNITYIDRGLGELSIPVGSREITANALPSTWKVVSYDEFVAVD